MATRIWLVVAGLLGASGVAIGAYQAHGLEAALAGQGLNASELGYRLDLCETAVRYQMLHALALLGVGILAAVRPGKSIWNVLGSGFLVGTVLFAGALYGIVMTGNSRYGAVAPLGGGCLILSWLAVAWAGVRWPPP